MNIKARLDRLEQHLKPSTVCVIYLADTDRVGLCDGSGEKLTLAECRQRYPDNVLWVVQVFAHEWMWDAL